MGLLAMLVPNGVVPNGVDMGTNLGTMVTVVIGLLAGAVIVLMDIHSREVMVHMALVHMALVLSNQL
jgi:hypothetical protein